MHTILAIVAILPPAALIAFLVGSLLLSGGQVTPGAGAKWDAVVPYPLFGMPAIVLLVLAAASVVLAVVLVLTARRGDHLGLRGLLGPLLGAVVAALGFSVFVPDGDGGRGDVFGDQLMAVPVSAAAFVIVLVGAVWVGRRRSAVDA